MMVRDTGIKTGRLYPRPSWRHQNLKRSLIARCHHLLKTFYTGPTGWAERQLPDGTVIWTAPTGHTYSTEPAGALIFPALKQSTGELVIPPAIDVPTLTARWRCRPANRPASRTAATASPRNDANEPGSSPKKNDNAKPGSPPTTNRHPSEAPATPAPESSEAGAAGRRTRAL